jgi:predicted CXXCH cytochrome family protein
MLIFGCLVFGLCFASVALAGTTPGSGINSSKHDLGAGYPSTDGSDTLTRICIYCHTPHHAFKLLPGAGGPGGGVGTGENAPSDLYDYLPLWNHLFSNYDSFQMYQNGLGAPGDYTKPKASQAIGQGAMSPGGVSMLCLSCHDGSQAVNAYGTVDALSQSRGTSKVIGSNLIGKDAYLGNHHPIGFDYDQVQAIDTEIRSADTAILGGAGFVRDHLYGPGNTMLECASCHSVHNKGNTGETLLWRSDQNSRLCLTCHNKGDDPGATVP